MCKSPQANLGEAVPTLLASTNCPNDASKAEVRTIVAGGAATMQTADSSGGAEIGAH